MRYTPYFAWALLVAFSCGGKQSVGSEPPGESNKSQSVADDLDVPDGMTDPGSEPGATSDGTGEAGVTETGAQAAVTFRLQNSAEDELVFSLDRGWQPVIFAFSGQPPNAEAIVMFPKFCTAACDAGEDAVCPYCPQPERVKDIRASEKREMIAPGGSLDVQWDGMVHVYEKTQGTQNGKRTSCECYKKAPVPAASYTVRACGLRITSSAKTSSKYQCVEGTMSFPAAEPQVIELDFPVPPQG